MLEKDAKLSIRIHAFILINWFNSYLFLLHILFRLQMTLYTNIVISLKINEKVWIGSR